MRQQSEAQIARDTLERYSGSSLEDFQSYLLLTNFPRYVEYFSESRQVPIIEGSMFKVAHCPVDRVSILDFKIGSPAAALAIDLCAYLPAHGSVFLGMCGGLRDDYKVGDYFIPVAGIRGEGTSDFYFPKEVPALANFLVQRAVSEVVEQDASSYQVGITYTLNKRFWEFNEGFIEYLRTTHAQAIEMECATLFAASYHKRFPLGALLLISDLPLQPTGIKTKESAKAVYEKFTADHVEKGIRIAKLVHNMLLHHAKGASRGLPLDAEFAPPL